MRPSTLARIRWSATFLAWLVLISSRVWAVDQAKPSDKGSVQSLLPSNKECVKCHRKLWDSELAKAFVHRPFLDKKCRYCHIEDGALVARSRGFMKDKGVDWLASRRHNTTAHWFSVPLAKVNGLLVVDLQVPAKSSQRQEIPLPALAKVPRLEDDHLPPRISQIRLIRLTQGLFLEATIGWQTDEIASSQVRYGEQCLNLSSPVGEELTTVHQVTISGLKVGKEYRFQVLSRDLFGNGEESTAFAFSTKGAKGMGSPLPAPTTEKDTGEVTLEHELFLQGDRLLIRCTTNRPAMMAVGSPKAERKEKDDLAASGARPDQHRLKDAVVTTNTICVPCHGSYVKDRNHPINVPPKPGMEVPEEYFLLANGNITCMTCHSAHASDIEYRLVRSSKRELCMGCHAGWI